MASGGGRGRSTAGRGSTIGALAQAVKLSNIASSNAGIFICFLLFHPADTLGPRLFFGARIALVGRTDLGALAVDVGGGFLHTVDLRRHDGVVERRAAGSTEQQAAHDEGPSGDQAHGFVTSVVCCTVTVLLVVPGMSFLLKTTFITSGATHMPP